MFRSIRRNSNYHYSKILTENCQFLEKQIVKKREVLVLRDLSKINPEFIDLRILAEFGFCGQVAVLFI